MDSPPFLPPLLLLSPDLQRGPSCKGGPPTSTLPAPATRARGAPATLDNRPGPPLRDAARSTRLRSSSSMPYRACQHRIQTHAQVCRSGEDLMMLAPHNFIPHHPFPSMHVSRESNTLPDMQQSGGKTLCLPIFCIVQMPGLNGSRLKQRLYAYKTEVKHMPRLPN